MACGSAPPSTTRDGSMKLRTAEPSCRNSGLETTLTTRPPKRRAIPSTSSPVPIGTVLLLTMTAPGRSRGASARIAPRTARRSAAPSREGGVCTAMKTTSAATGYGYSS